MLAYCHLALFKGRRLATLSNVICYYYRALGGQSGPLRCAIDALLRGVDGALGWKASGLSARIITCSKTSGTVRYNISAEVLNCRSSRPMSANGGRNVKVDLDDPRAGTVLCPVGWS